jgi:AbrB family looped-hinge helix DNA binding protein
MRGEAVRITAKGQVTIPQAVREAAGLLPNTDVDFVIDDGTVRIVKSTSSKRLTRGARAIQQLRRHGRHVSMTTDEIMVLTRDER